MVQADQGTNPIIGWLILVYDRNAEQRSPLQRKWYRFNYDKATPEEVAKVLKLVKWRQPDPTGSDYQAPVGEWQTMYEMSSAVSDRSPDILQFRRLFEFVPENQLIPSDRPLGSGFRCVSLPPESYFEDEQENPITLTQILDAEAQRTSGKNAKAIVFDHPESVLRHSPASPLRPEFWNSNDAALFAQLFEVHRQLMQSIWIRSPFEVASKPDGKYQAIFPVGDAVRAVVLPFRQLYSTGDSDNLFNRCCKIHSRHCPTSHPFYLWIDHYKARFNGYLEHPPGFPPLKRCVTARRHLDAFGYGALVVHASPNDDTPAQDLHGLLEGNPQEFVVMAYHQILQTLLSYVSMTVPIFQKNVAHWVNDLGWKWEGCIDSRALFG